MNPLDLSLSEAVDPSQVPDAARLRIWVAAALESVASEGTVSIRVVDDAESAELNRRYRDRDRPTNVLSFPLARDDRVPARPAEAGPAPLGDLAICAEVVRREAAEQGKDAEAHWAHMVVHGVLHLLGHEHDDDADAEAMESLERDVMARLGYPDPYRVPQAAPASEDSSIPR